MPPQGDKKTHPPQSEPTVPTGQEPQGRAGHGHLLRPPFSLLPRSIIFFSSTLLVLSVFCFFLYFSFLFVFLFFSLFYSSCASI